MGDPKDEAKKIVLARRARFVAAAVASLGVACSGGTGPAPADGGTHVVDGGNDAGPDVDPQPCLTAPYDAGEEDTGAPADAGADAEPMPCLSPPADGG